MVSVRTTSAMSTSDSMRVRRSNPLARGLKFWPVIVSAQNYVRCVVSGVVGTPTNPLGISDDFSEEGHGIASDNYVIIDFDDTVTDIGTGPFTIVARCNPISDGNFRGPMSLPNNTNMCMYVPAGGTVRFAIDTTSQGTSYFSPGGTVTGIWSTFSVAMAGSGVGDPIGHFNGRNIVPDNVNSYTYAGGTDHVAFMVAGTAPSQRGYRGRLAWASLWNRLLSEAEHLQLHDNPRQMFEESRRVMWIPSASVAVSPLHYGAFWM